MNILLLGPQGSGKGTQAKRIASEYGLPHIATGDILRRAIADGTDLGRQVEPILASGGLVPDDLMVELIRARLREEDAADGFVLDGFPRTIAQADALDEMLREIDKELSVVFALQLDDSVVYERLARRAEEEGRTDDTPEVIGTRLDNYHSQTEPVIEYYRSSTGNVVPVHADRSINEVFTEIQQALEHVAVRQA